LDDIEPNRWYFVELSWDQHGGLKMFVDLDLVEADSSPVTAQLPQVDTDGTRVYLGTDMSRTSYASVTVDDLEFWFGERSKLIELDFLQRG